MPRGDRGGDDRVFATPVEDMSSADQLLMLEFNEFHEKVRYRNGPSSSFSIPYTEEEKELASISPYSLLNLHKLRGGILRFHGWACREPFKGKRPKHVSLIKILKSTKHIHACLHYFHDERKCKPGTLITMCQSIISALKFMLRSADPEEKIDIERVWKETRDYMRYLSRRVAQDDSRKSLCELRENGEALNFMDLAKVSRCQYVRVGILQKALRTRKLSMRSKYTLQDMYSKNLYRLALLSTLLKYPLRTSEAGQAMIRWTAMGSGMLTVTASSRKGGSSPNISQKFPFAVKLSRTHARVFKCLQAESQNIDKAATTWNPFKASMICETLKNTTHEMTGVSVTVQELRAAAESYVDTLPPNCAPALKQVGLSYAEGHTERAAKMHYKINSRDVLMRPWTNHVNQLVFPEPSVSLDAKDETDIRIENDIKDSHSKWLQEVNAIVQEQYIPSLKALKNMRWTSQEDEALIEGIKKFGLGPKNLAKILDDSPTLQQRCDCYATRKKALNALNDHWRQCLEAKVNRPPPPKVVQEAPCQSCGSINPTYSRSQKKKRCELRKCTICVKRELLATAGECDAEETAAPKRRRKKRRKKNVAVSPSQTELQSKHFTAQPRQEPLSVYDEETDNEDEVHQVVRVKKEDVKNEETDDENEARFFVVNKSLGLEATPNNKQDSIENESKFDKKWMEHFEELKEYKSSNGNDANTQLARWVSKQREYYKKNNLSEKRTQLLEGIGFLWIIPRGTASNHATISRTPIMCTASSKPGANMGKKRKRTSTKDSTKKEDASTPSVYNEETEDEDELLSDTTQDDSDEDYIEEDIEVRECGEGSVLCTTTPNTRNRAKSKRNSENRTNTKKCQYKGCAKYAQKGGRCVDHVGKEKRCTSDGCMRQTTQGGHCIEHSGVEKRRNICDHEGCTKQAVKGVLTKRDNLPKRNNVLPKDTDGHNFCLFCGSIKPIYSRSQRKKGCELRKCTLCVQKTLLATAGARPLNEIRGPSRRRRRKKAKKQNTQLERGNFNWPPSQFSEVQGDFYGKQLGRASLDLQNHHFGTMVKRGVQPMTTQPPPSQPQDQPEEPSHRAAEDSLALQSTPQPNSITAPNLPPLNGVELCGETTADDVATTPQSPSMAQPNDGDYLSEKSTFARLHFFVLFIATEEDCAKKVKGRIHKPIVGQVGLRCACCDTDLYSKGIEHMESAAKTLLRRHTMECSKISEELKVEFQELNQNKPKGTGMTVPNYWIHCLVESGVYEEEGRLLYNAPS